MALSSLPGMANVTILLNETFGSSEDSAEAPWHLQLVLSARIVKLDELNFLSMRGSLHSYIDELKEYTKLVACVSYESFSTYDPSVLLIVERPVWIAIILTSLVISYVLKDFSKGFYVLKLSMGFSFDEEGFDRRLIVCFMIPITFYYNLFQSYISSDSTKLPDFPQDLNWFMKNGFRMSHPMAGLAPFAYHTLAPVHLKERFFELTHSHNPYEYFTDEIVLITNMTDMAKFISERKIAVANYIEQYSFFSYFFDEYYALIDNKYACFARKSPLFESFTLVGIRFYGYLSTKFEHVLFKFLERGEFVKFRRLSSHIHFLQRTKQKTKVVNLDKVAPPQPIDSKSIVGLSCVTVYGIGLVILAVRIVVWLSLVIYNNLKNISQKLSSYLKFKCFKNLYRKICGGISKSNNGDQ